MPFIVGQQLLRRDGNVGMVTVTLTGPNLLHGLPAGRSARICKIVAYNNSGAPAVLTLGTLTALGAFTALMPPLYALNGLDNIWTEQEIPAVEWIKYSVSVSGMTGDIWISSSVAGPQVVLEVEEKF